MSNTTKNFWTVANNEKTSTQSHIFYLDYLINGKSKVKNIFKRKHITLKRDTKVIIINDIYVLVSTYVNSSDMKKFEECMSELLKSSLSNNGYKNTVEMLKDLDFSKIITIFIYLKAKKRLSLVISLLLHL